jgi:hypothetical protein
MICFILLPIANMTSRFFKKYFFLLFQNKCPNQKKSKRTPPKRRLGLAVTENGGWSPERR